MEAKSKNYYEILEVPVGASHDEIQEGYIKTKNAYSENSLALYSILSEKECKDMISRIEEAYSIISDPVKRKLYDSARGFETCVEQAPSAAVETSPATEKNEANKISRLVASQKFALDFEQDLEFENEIEKADEFSGEFLQKIREYKKVNLNRLAEMTKVSKTYLSKIENEDTTNLPALVYVRGFVYQYAKCLKLNPDLVANSYIKRLKTNLEAN
ncbi:MAG: helix-turn-helix domain-containing protein [Bacteriovoracaceae bacterium]